MTKQRPLDVQIGGDHYKRFGIQPVEFALANGLDTCSANALKYLVRRKGDRVEDLRKAVHYIDIRLDWKPRAITAAEFCEANRLNYNESSVVVLLEPSPISVPTRLEFAREILESMIEHELRRAGQ